MKALLTAMGGVAIGCLAVVGCDLGDVGCVTGSTIETVCSTQSNVFATLTRPGVQPADVKFDWTDGNCDGACTAGYVSVDIQSSQGAFVCLISLSSNAALLTAQTFTLPSDELFVSCNTTDDTSSFFSPLAGAFTIDAVDATSLHAIFSMELARADDGATAQISSGSISINGCHDAEVCTF
jgi:hypothetical protein